MTFNGLYFFVYFKGYFLKIIFHFLSIFAMIFLIIHQIKIIFTIIICTAFWIYSSFLITNMIIFTITLRKKAIFLYIFIFLIL